LIVRQSSVRILSLAVEEAGLEAVGELPHLTLRVARMRFSATAEARFPAFPGSAWRGAFGQALKRLVCVMQERPCEGCPLQATCIFPAMFGGEPSPDVPAPRRLASAPPPFALRPPPRGPTRLADGSVIDLETTLIGRGTRWRAYVDRALEDAAARGIGPDRVPLRLERIVEIEPAPPTWPRDGALRLSLLTPVRLKRDGRHVGPAAFRPVDLLMAMVRRTGALGLLQDRGMLDEDPRALRAAAEMLRWRHLDVRWQDTVRRSTRQDAVLRMGGLVGEAVLDTAALAPFRTILSLAPWIGVGAGVTMGLGQVRVEAA
jgi:hypothetical protein